MCKEGLEDGALELAAARNGHLHGVDRLVVEANLVMKMGAGGPAGRANIADDLALVDFGAGCNVFGEAAHVGVKGLIAIGVLEPDHVAISCRWGRQTPQFHCPRL